MRLRLGPVLRVAALIATVASAVAVPATARGALYTSAGTCSGLGDLGLCSTETFTLEPPATLSTAQPMLNVVDDFGPPFGAGSLDAEAMAVARHGEARRRPR